MSLGIGRQRLTGFEIMREYESSLLLESTPKELDRLRGWFCSSVRGFKDLIQDSAVGIIATALTEAFNNAVFHGHRSDISKMVEVRLKFISDAIELKVIDSGSGIEELRRDLPPADEAKGRGLYIIRKLMTEIGSTVEDGRHIFTMRYIF